MDNLTRSQRHKNMANIRSSNTKPELVVRKYLYSQGYRYRINVKNLPGKPDIAVKKYSIAIFIHGCFWHQHPGCKYASTPKSNMDYWQNKLQRNVERDKQNQQRLTDLGFHVLTLWECDINKSRFINIMNDFLNQHIPKDNP